MIQLEQELHSDSKPSFQMNPISDHQCDIFFQIPAGLTYFKGHFPNFPILPAVGLLDITSYLTVKAFALQSHLRLEKVFQVKVAAGLQPEQEISIQLFRQPDSTYKALWFSKEKTKVAELSFSYSHQPACSPADTRLAKSEFS